jgi:hypothetical protein
VEAGKETADLSSTLRSGRDDKFIAARISYFSGTRNSILNRILISTEAYQDFLPRSPGQDRVCAFLQRKGA